MRILVALDQGTTSSRAIVFDETGRTLASHAIEFKQHYPKPGWVEHDPEDILGTQVEALQKAAFFTLRALCWLDTGIFPASRAALPEAGRALLAAGPEELFAWAGETLKNVF